MLENSQISLGSARKTSQNQQNAGSKQGGPHQSTMGEQRAPRFAGTGGKNQPSKAPDAVDTSWQLDDSIGSAQHGDEQNINQSYNSNTSHVYNFYNYYNIQSVKPKPPAKINRNPANDEVLEDLEDW